MHASDVRDLDAAAWAVVLSPTRDMTPSGMKLCVECGALKELTEFRKDTLRHDGRKSQCKACLKEIEAEARRRAKSRTGAPAYGLCACCDEKIALARVARDLREQDWDLIAQIRSEAGLDKI